ncbi:MAG: hypothetical protein R3B06_10235 [Kofleriaceae bacterium]
MKSTVVVAIILCAGCHGGVGPRAPVFTPGTRCVALPGTMRDSLQRGPDGRSLYWRERRRVRGFADTWSQWDVVRWDLDERPPRRMAERATTYRVRADGAVVAPRDDDGLFLWGDTVEAISWSGAISGFDLVDDATAVYVAGGLWRQPLTRVASTWLHAGGPLVGRVPGGVVAVVDDEVLAIDAATGTATTLPLATADLARVFGAYAVYVSERKLEVVGPDRRRATVLEGDGLDWWTTPQHVVLLQTTGARTRVATVDADGLRWRPDVDGARWVLGAAPLADGRVFYLLAHDVDGNDRLTVDDEADLCVSDGAPVVVAPRRLPARFADRAAQLDRVVADLGATSWTFTDDDSLPAIELRSARRPTGLADIGDQLGRAVAGVVAALGDPTINVGIAYADHRRGLARFTPSVRRHLRWAGIGAAQQVDPRDREVRLIGQVVRLDDAHARCTGTIENRGARTLTALTVQCAAEGESVAVSPATLAPGARGQFAAVVDAAADATLRIKVLEGPGEDELSTQDQLADATRAEVIAAAADVLDRVGLVLDDWRADAAEVVVTFHAPAGFDGWSASAATNVADVAYRRFGATGPELLDGHAGQPIVIELVDGDARWRYDGADLTNTSE